MNHAGLHDNITAVLHSVTQSMIERCKKNGWFVHNLNDLPGKVLKVILHGAPRLCSQDLGRG